MPSLAALPNRIGSFTILQICAIIIIANPGKHLSDIGLGHFRNESCGRKYIKIIGIILLLRQLAGIWIYNGWVDSCLILQLLEMISLTCFGVSLDFFLINSLCRELLHSLGRRRDLLSEKRVEVVVVFLLPLLLRGVPAACQNSPQTGGSGPEARSCRASTRSAVAWGAPGLPSRFSVSPHAHCATPAPSTWGTQC